MKKTALLLLLTAFVFASCGKYEDGPDFSLSSKNSRLIGQWNTIVMEGDTLGTDVTNVIDLQEEGTMKVTFSMKIFGQWIPTEFNGTWAWTEDKEGIQLIAQNDTTTLTITRLTKDELWVLDEDSKKWELEKID